MGIDTVLRVFCFLETFVIIIGDVGGVATHDLALPTVNVSAHGRLDVTGGTPLKLLCTAGGTPAPNITWYKDGQVVTSSDDISVTQGNLTVSHMTGYDVGDYSCTATNDLGATSSAPVKVKVTGLHFAKRLPPEVTKYKGQHGILPCQGLITNDVTNDSRTKTRVSVSWHFKDHVISAADYRFEKTQDGLILRKVELRDAGQYRCEAHVGNVTIRMTTRLIVQSLPVPPMVHLALTLSHKWPPGVVCLWRLHGTSDDVRPVGVTSYNLVVKGVLRHQGKRVVKMITVSTDITSLTLTDLIPGRHYEVTVWANSKGGQGPGKALHFVAPWSHTAIQALESTGNFLDVGNPQFWLAFTSGGAIMTAVFFIITSLSSCLRSQWSDSQSLSGQDTAGRRDTSVGGVSIPSPSLNQSWGFVNPSFNEESTPRENPDKVSLNNLELIWTNQTRF